MFQETLLLREAISLFNIKGALPFESNYTGHRRLNVFLWSQKFEREMKKALIFIIGLAAIFGCNKVEFVSGNSDKDAIVFDNVQTKAVVSSADQILSMGVLAQMNLGVEGESGYNKYVMLLDNEHVSRTSPFDPWTYENTRYWVTDRAYHFFAVWPYSGDPDSPVTNVSSVATPNNGEYSYSVTFTTPDDAKQELLTAQKSEMTHTGVSFPTSVDFSMQHELTNVHFKIWRDAKDDDNAHNIRDEIRVKKVVLSNVTKKATLTANRTSSSWRHSSDKMEIVKDYGDKPIDVSGAIIGDNGEFQTITDGKEPGIPFETDGLLLIPHTINSNTPVIIKVIYDLWNFELQDWEEKTLQAFLPEGTWPAGKIITYNLVLSGERTITQFEIITEVKDWTVQTDEIDFSEQVSSNDPIEWIDGTYQSHDNVNCELVVFSDESVTATCKFKIDTPVGSTWTASLIPLTASAMDAFSIVEDTKYGDVGTGQWQYVKIKVNNQAPMAPRHVCKLRITVQTADGRSIVVKELMPDTAAKGIEEYTIIQNLING